MPRFPALAFCLLLTGCGAMQIAAPIALAGTEAVLREVYRDDPEKLAAALALLDALRAAIEAAEEAKRLADQAEPSAAALAHEDAAKAEERVVQLRLELKERLDTASPAVPR